jgi:hypothetical protein
MDDEPWHVRRLRELEAMAPVKRKREVEPFVKVPLWWAAAAAKAVRAPDMLVCIELLRASWKAKSLTFPLPNGRLKRAGVSRKIKSRVLRDLEGAGLIVVDGRHGKTPNITLTAL